MAYVQHRVPCCRTTWKLKNNKENNNELVETRLVVYYDIQDASSPITVCSNYDYSMKSMEVDGVMLDSVVTTYQFDSVGEHIIKYEFNNPTSVGNGAPLFYNVGTIKRIVIPNIFTIIGNSAFSNCSKLTSILIPDSVTTIGGSVFGSCSGLTSVTIGSGVTTIGNNAFYGCSGLTSITSNATTAPTIDSSTFQNVKTNGTLYVPQGSSGYDVWMGTENYYLGKYNWTKIEQ